MNGPDLLSRPAELKECDPVCHSLAHLGSSGVGEGHQEHHRGPGPRVLLQCRDRLWREEEQRHHNIRRIQKIYCNVTTLKSHGDSQQLIWTKIND